MRRTKFKYRWQRNWRSKDHPYLFVRRWENRSGTVQVGPVEIYWRKR